jgi:DNA adenine methylase
MPQTDSPLRYPGGKAKLYSLVEPIVTQNLPNQNRLYIEPFAGGAGLALHLLFQGNVDALVLNDLDYHISCFWEECLFNSERLCDKIQHCEISMDTWRNQRQIYDNEQTHAPDEIAFSTFFLNRCNVSGIICGGPIGGADQSGSYGLDARFKRNDLIRKIQAIAARRDQITFYNLDARRFLSDIVPNYNVDSTLLNIDPPYVKKGPTLYRNSFTQQDHEQLAHQIAQLNHKWITTYDECDLINRLYGRFRREIITLNYSAGHTKQGKELLIYSDSIVLEN